MKKVVLSTSCRFCGSDKGFYTKLTGTQYYDKNGEEDGYEVDSESIAVYCRNCHKKRCTKEELHKLIMKEILK